MGVRGVVWDEIDFDDELYNVKYYIDRSFTNVILGVVIVMLIYAGKR